MVRCPGCIAGGLLEAELYDLLVAAAFTNVEIVRGSDVF
jgi:hypothetical protein